ncbi:hypothetical protein KBX53_00390 [Micromonospora sp. M51]|uniref:hypothetical protein n=1 Tax=Micromonospora sp. M51 TaxID=2824889 RepID=UPI001B3740B6|nr:hypothetical protein [Micromonospora sp. M51]MBQ1009439.1 hypothetical protein [Micromonospora sp. M51]
MLVGSLIQVGSVLSVEPKRKSWMLWLLTILAACLVTVLSVIAVRLSVTYEPPRGTEPPKITDWMQGWGSLAGVLAGAGAAVAASWLLVHERQQSREARVEAEQVGARAVQYSSLFGTMWRSPSGGARLSINFKVTNYGPQPARRVVAVARCPRAPHIWVIFVAEILEPHDSCGGSGMFELPDALLPPTPLTSMGIDNFLTDISLTLRFFDFNGREWQRTDHGDPVRAREPVPPGEPAAEYEDQP